MSNLIFPHPPGWALKVVRVPINVTLIQTSDSGQESRIRKLTVPRYRYEIEINALRADQSEFQQMLTFLGRHGGRYDSFLWQDPEDNAVTSAGFGLGDGATTAFQLQRTLGGQVQDLLGTWDTYTTPRTNIALRSAALSTSPWTVAASGSVSAASIIAPDGSVGTTWNLSMPAVSSYIYQPVTGSFPSGSTWTFSIWLNGPVGQTTHIRIDPGVSTTASVTLTGGWQRVSVSATLGSSATTINVGVRRDVSGDTTSVVAWGAQLEAGSVATQYIPTTSTAATDNPVYWPGLSDGFEPVYDPVWSSVSLWKNGVALVPVTDFTPGTNGMVMLTSAPASGAVLTWSGSYYRRVRSEDDEPHFERLWPGVWKASLSFESVLP